MIEGPPELADYAALLGDRLHLPDPSHFLFALAVAVSAHDAGEPLWGMIVGQPSSAKTEAVRALDGVTDAGLDELTSASLLTWLGSATKGRPAGILTRVPDPSLVTVGDFSTVLAMSDKGARDVLFALLRRVHDGSVSRSLATAPQPLTWTGRLTMLAAVTPAIDNFSAHADALGPRWLYLRVRDLGSKDRSRALSRRWTATADDATWRGQVAAEGERLVREARGRLGDSDVPAPAALRLDRFATVAALGRVAVPRSGYGPREIIGVPVAEEPYRLAGQLHTLARALLALGIGEDQALDLARRAALDSMPQARRGILDALAAGEPLYTSAVAERAHLDRKVARHALEDLACIDLCTYDGQHDEDEPTRKLWRLAGQDAQLVVDVLAEVGRKVGTTHTTPTEGREGQAPHLSSHTEKAAA